MVSSHFVRTIYEDDSLLIIDKPAGLVVDRSETQKENTLEDWLADRAQNLDRRGIVHRLDKDTSGIILVAKTSQALENLQGQFKERLVKKQYLALVHGLVEEGGIVEGSIGRNPGNREKFTVVNGPTRSNAPDLVGRQAVTEYEPLEKLQFTEDRLQEIYADFNKIQMRKLERMKYNQFTLLSCKPLTGRTHQIRVHLKYINHPIVSDEKYVGRKMYRLDKRWCPRMFLHAKRIGFYHPVKDKWMEVESELPEDLEKALKNLTLDV